MCGAQLSGAQLELWQISVIKIVAKIVNGLKLLTVLGKV